MKYLVLSLTAFLFTTTASNLWAQSDEELSQQLFRDLETYRKHTLAMNFDSSLLFMPPKTFELVPLDSLKANMVQAFKNEYLDISMAAFDVEAQYKPEIRHAGIYHWAIVPYSGKLRMILKGEPQVKEMLIPVMKSQFGAENVQMEGDSTMLVALKDKKLVAFRQPDSPIWHMIEDKRAEIGPGGAAQRQFFNSVVPQEVLIAIGK